MNKLYAYALVYIQTFRFIGATVSEFCFSDEEHGKSEIITYFHPFFWHAVTFSHVLHLDVIRSLIELKLKFPYVWL